MDSTNSMDRVVYPKEINLVVGQTCLVSLDAEHYENDSLVFSTNAIEWMSEDTSVACVEEIFGGSAVMNGVTVMKKGYANVKANSVGECTIWADYYKKPNASITRMPILVTVTDHGYTTYNPCDTVFIRVGEIKTVEFESTNSGPLLGWEHHGDIENWDGGLCGLPNGISSVHQYSIEPQNPFEVSMTKIGLDWVGVREGNLKFSFIIDEANINLEIPIKVLPNEE